MSNQEINAPNTNTLPKRSFTPGTETEELSLTRSPRKIQFNYKLLALIIFGAILAISSGLATYFFWWLPQQPHIIVEISLPTTTTPTYSSIDGLPLSDPSLNTSPTFCVQIPNGADGARPQAALTKARVVYEVIAERGITRFAAIFQNYDGSAIGPIRSLRPYYLEWDTPYDCTIVHAGGSYEALTAIRSGRYRDLSENNTFMYRTPSSGTGLTRRWNNLFTSQHHLNNFNNSKGYAKSNVKGFARLTPQEASRARVKLQTKTPFDITKANTGATANFKAPVETFQINFGNSTTYNTVYRYHYQTNSYHRAFANGAAHTAYSCSADLKNPVPERHCGSAIQISPSVVIAMVVQEHRATDGYHEVINTTGKGTAHIFQNGGVTKGTWERTSIHDQLVFKDETGKVIHLIPGQTWVAAVPQYGSIIY